MAQLSSSSRTMLSHLLIGLSILATAVDAQTPTFSPNRPTVRPTIQPTGVTQSPSTSPVKGYRAVVIVIVVSCCIGVGMFVMLAIIVAIKRGNACSEHGPCAHCCGEQQGYCCADIDKTTTIDPAYKCCSPLEGFYSHETYGCVGSLCMPSGGFFGQKEASWCPDDRCDDCCIGGGSCVKTGPESLSTVPLGQPPIVPAQYAPNPIYPPTAGMPMPPMSNPMGPPGMVMMQQPGMGMMPPQQQPGMGMMIPPPQQQPGMGGVEMQGYYNAPSVPV